MTGKDDLLGFLASLGIAAKTYEHPPIMTVADGHEHWKGIDAVHCKNLFLKDAKANLWLVSAPGERPIDLKKLPDRIGAARLSFGRGELLEEVLGVPPGSVTPFALINDKARRVSFVLDREMMAAPLLSFHPMVNTATTTISPDGLMVFLKAIGVTPRLAALG